MSVERISEAFSVIADYAIAQGWVPIGFRRFSVGPWEITVNGTHARCEDIEPYHAHVVNKDVIAIMVLNPYAGSVGGWKDTEAQFIADMTQALASVPSKARE